MQQRDYFDELIETLDVFSIPERFVFDIMIVNHPGEPYSVTHKEFMELKEKSPETVSGARVMVNTKMMRAEVKEVTDWLFATYPR